MFDDLINKRPKMTQPLCDVCKWECKVSYDGTEDDLMRFCKSFYDVDTDTSEILDPDAPTEEIDMSEILGGTGEAVPV